MNWEEGTLELPLVEPGVTIEVSTVFYGVWAIAHREANDGKGSRHVPWGNRERWYLFYAPNGESLASQTVQSKSSDTLEELKRYVEQLPQIVTGDIERLQEKCMEVRDEMNLDLEAA